MSDDMQWEAPPEAKAGGPTSGHTKRFIEALKTRPGEWAKYPKQMGHPSAPSAYRKQYPGTEWKGRKSSTPGKWDMWARWVGES